MPNHEGLGLLNKNSHELAEAFGKSALDEIAMRPFAQAKGQRVWLAVLSLAVVTLLTELQVSNRVLVYSSQPLALDGGKIQLRGGRLIIPPLILDFPKQPAGLYASVGYKAAPIQVLSFLNQTHIPPGAEAVATLSTGGTNGLIKARLAQPLKYDGVVYIDAGAVLIGQGHSTDERLFIAFTKAVLRDGKTIPISAQGYDESDRVLGLKGSRVGDLTLKLAATSGLNFVSGMSAGLETSSYNMYGQQSRPTAQDAALSGVSKAAAEQAQSYMQDLKNKPPIIEVKAGTQFIVTFDEGGN